MVHDMIEVEKMGKPAIPIVSGRFDGDAVASSRAFGMPDLQWVVVPRIYRNLALDECVRQTEVVIDEIVKKLTSNGSAAKPVEAPKIEPLERFHGTDRFEAAMRMNEEFMKRDLGDGFPLLPSTSESVDALLKGTKLPADHVVCDMPPGLGV